MGKWEHEQIMSNKTAKLDEHKRDCNRLIIGLDIDEVESKNLMKAEPEHVKSWAHDMNISLKDEVRQLSQQCKKFRENLNLVQKEMEKKDKEDNKLKEEEMKIQSEKSELIPQIGEEEENLKLK